jgi:hypothetical protein
MIQSAFSNLYAFETLIRCRYWLEICLTIPIHLDSVPTKKTHPKIPTQLISLSLKGGEAMRRLFLMIAVLGAMLSMMLLCLSHDPLATENGKYNILKEKIQSGEVVKGVYAAMKDPFIAQVLARAGFDFIWIDLEHTSLGWGDVERIIQAISSTRMVPIVRVPWNEHYLIKRALDIGAKGIIVPMVNTREEAIAAVQACLYPPQGIRGFGPTKAAFYWGIPEIISFRRLSVCPPCWKCA